jgi:hypothetical protein
VSIISPSFGRSYVLDDNGFVGGPGSPGPCMGAEGLLDQSEIALLVPPGSAKLDMEAFSNSAPFRANEWTHFDESFTLTSKVRSCPRGHVAPTRACPPTAQEHVEDLPNPMPPLPDHNLLFCLRPPQYCFAKYHCVGGMGLRDLDRWAE